MLKEGAKVLRVGVLGLQGGVEEHISALKSLENVMPVWVRTREDFEGIDGLILPGGESTTLGKLLHRLDLMDFLRDKIASGLPVWGTCAGMILLADQIEGQDETHLKLLHVKVSRNAFGRQLDSFDKLDNIPAVSEQPIRMRFIRAPRIMDWDKEKVEVLYKIDEFPVAVRQGNILATSFHPELVGENQVHQYFVDMIYKI